MRFEGPRDGLGRQEYTNPYLTAIYKYRRSGKNPTYPEYRIHLLYQSLEKRIMPWMWDHENYTGVNADMYGRFYDEDFQAIWQIQSLQNEYKEPKK